MGFWSELFGTEFPQPVSMPEMEAETREQAGAVPPQAEEREATGANYSGSSKQMVFNCLQAMQIAAVHRCVDLISSGVASLTLQRKRFNKRKDCYVIDDTPEGGRLNYLLSCAPNQSMNSFQFMKNLVLQRLLYGNAYIYVKRGYDYSISELILCSNGSVTHDIYNHTYTIADSINGIHQTLTEGDLLCFKNISLDGGHDGISITALAKRVLSVAATGDEETLNRFATGGRFKAILQNDTVQRGLSGKYNDKDLKKLGMDLQEQLGKYDILVMRGDGKLTPYSMASTDMQFLETRKHIDADIARFFNVPLALLYADTSSNYNTQQQANLAFYTQTLQPILTDIEREFNAKLLSQTTYKNCKFQFDLSALNSLDPASKVQYNKGRLETGVATVNDLRKENDMPPVEGGDKTYVSVQVAQLGPENEEPVTTNEEGGEQ